MQLRSLSKFLFNSYIKFVRLPNDHKVSHKNEEEKLLFHTFHVYEGKNTTRRKRKTDDFVITACDELKNAVKTPQAFEQHISPFQFCVLI